MFRFKNISIRFKLVAMQVSTAFVVLVCTGIFLVLKDKQVFQKSMIDDLTSMAQLIGANTVSTLNFLDDESAEDILATLVAEEDVVNAWIYDGYGNLFAGYNRPGYTNFEFPKIEQESYVIDGDFLTLSKRVVQGDETIGMISLRSSMTQFRTLVNQSILAAILLLTFGTFIALIIAHFTQRTISRPILDLVEISNKVSETGNYSIRSQKSGHDEIGTLCDTFNRMMAQIQNRELERDRAERAVRESENKFRTLTSNIPGAVYRCANDPDWTMDFISDEIENISGYKASDFIENKVRSFASCIHPDDRNSVEIGVQEAISKRMPYILEYRIVRSDDVLRWVYEKGQGMFSDDGNLLWLDGAIFDITERRRAEDELARHRDHLEELVEIRTAELTKTNNRLKEEIEDHERTEQALRESENRLDSIINNSPAVIYLKDLEGRYILINRRYEELFHITNSQIRGKTDFELFPQETAEMMRENDRRTYKTGNTIQTEEIVPQDDGLHTYISVKFPINDASGKPYAICGISTDITERKKADQSLKQSEEKFRSLVANIPDVTWTSDCNGKMVFMSPNVEKVYGFSPDQIYRGGDSAWLDRIHRDDLEQVKDAYQSLITKNKRYDVEYRIRRKDGEWIWLHDRAIAAYEQNGVMFADGVFSDITEKKQTEIELKDTQAQLMQAEKMASLGMLVAGVAHEINTPVGAINSMFNTQMRAVEKLKGALEQICRLDAKSQKKVNDLFKIIEDANNVINSGSKRVTNIVQRLKSFARLDEAELQTVDIHEGIEDTLIIVHHELKHKAEVVRHYGDIPPISCFPSQLNQVYLNILVNAVQAIKEKGIISITTFARDNHVYIQFQDNGVGISKETLAKIFDPGFTTKGVGVGTGLGLSICYQIVKDHHGRIMVESEVGRGTTFTIVLPITPPV